MPESAVRGEEYIAVLSAHARKCASSAHFVLERTSKNIKKLKKGVDICSIMDYTKQVVSERAITTEKDMAV